MEGWHNAQGLWAKGDAKLAQAVVMKQPFQNVNVQLAFTANQIVLSDLSARLHGGLVKGDVDVRLQDPIWHKTTLKADGVNLGLLVRHALDKRGPIQGNLSAQLQLNGRGKELRSLRGEGKVVIAEGVRLCELPVFFELANHVSRALPKATTFQDAVAEMSVEGERLTVKRLDVMSDALTLRGHGQVDIDGSNLNLELFGMPYGRTLPNLPPYLDRIPPALSKQFLRIRATGALTNVHIHTEALPALTDPLRDMMKTFKEKPADSEPPRP